MICSIFLLFGVLCSKWLSFVYMTVICVHFCCATVVSNNCHKLLDMTSFGANLSCPTFMRVNGHICGHGCGLCRLLISLSYSGNLPLLGHVCNLCTFLFSNFSAANWSAVSDLTVAVHIVIKSEGGNWSFVGTSLWSMHIVAVQLLWQVDVQIFWT